MSTVVVRPVAEEEQLAWRRSANRTFLEVKAPTEAQLPQRRREWEGQRLVGAFEGDRVVGTYRSWEAPVPVPGGGCTVESDLVSSVSVAPTHRRRGLLRQMITADLRDARERGVPMALLVAGEAPIYGRYGFGTAVCAQTLVVCAPAVLEHLPPGTGEVTVELVEDGDLRSVAPDVYAGAAVRRPGAVERGAAWWDQVLGIAPPPDDATVLRPALVARDASGTAVGFARYRAREQWAGMRHDSTVTVDDLAAVTPAAHAALWSHLLSLDIVDAVRAERRPIDDPLPELLHDRRRALASEGSDFLWARLLDVPAALAARRYLGPPGACVLQVDDALGLAGGRWRLDVDADRRVVASPTHDEPDVVADVGALSAAYLGETPLLSLQAAGRVTGSREAVARLSAQLAWQPDAWPTLTSF